MGDISEHFSEWEFRCHGARRKEHPPHGTVVQPQLLEALEELRFIVGRPLTIVSGFRCEWWNRRVDGADRSMHVTGHAVDLPWGVVRQHQAERAGFRGIGTERGYAIHVDVRSRAARWSYPR